MNTPQTPQNPSPEPRIPLNQEILNEMHKYVDIAAHAVTSAETQGVGKPGATKAQIALGIANTAAETAGLIVPGAGAAITGAEALEPIFMPLFTSFVNLFKKKGGAPAPGNISPLPPTKGL